MEAEGNRSKKEYHYAVSHKHQRIFRFVTRRSPVSQSALQKQRLSSGFQINKRRTIWCGSTAKIRIRFSVAERKHQQCNQHDQHAEGGVNDQWRHPPHPRTVRAIRQRRSAVPTAVTSTPGFRQLKMRSIAWQRPQFNKELLAGTAGHRSVGINTTLRSVSVRWHRRSLGQRR